MEFLQADLQICLLSSYLSVSYPLTAYYPRNCLYSIPLSVYLLSSQLAVFYPPLCPPPILLFVSLYNPACLSTILPLPLLP
jgi:hypothetical protein